MPTGCSMNKIVKVLSSSILIYRLSYLFTKPSFVSFCYLISAIAVCDKSKTVFDLHDTTTNDSKEKKARSSCNRFIRDGDRYEDEISQRKADLFFEELGLKEGNHILLIIDDIYNEKKGKHT